MTKTLIEKESQINIFINREERAEVYNDLLRAYKSFKIYNLDETKELYCNMLMKKYGRDLENLEICSGKMTISKFFEYIIQKTKALKSLVFRYFDFEGDAGNFRIRSDLEALTLEGMTNPPMEIFLNCCNLRDLVYTSYFELDYPKLRFDHFFVRQRSLKNLCFDEDVLLSAQVSQHIHFQLESLTYQFIVHKPWPPALLFLNTQRDIKVLSVQAQNIRESFDYDTYMEENLLFIFNLPLLETLHFDHMGCEQLKIRRSVLKKAKTNLNLKTLAMKNDVDGTIGTIFNVLLTHSPNIEVLAFRFNDKLPMNAFANINKLSNLTKMFINGCNNPGFKLSKFVIGDKLTDFSYGGKDLKPIEYKKFFANHTKLAHVTLYIKKFKNKMFEFAHSLIVLKNLRTLKMHVKDFPEEMKKMIQNNLKLLYSFSVEDPEIDTNEEDSEAEADE